MLEKINKDLEVIIKKQLQYEKTLKEALAAEKKVSGTLLKKWLDREQTITDWDYSYWVLQRKFTRALKDIRFLSHYIETQHKKKKNSKKK
jgi:hypothetical protein